MVNTTRVRNRLVWAEDGLATHAQTVVCRPAPAQRWEQPYGVDHASSAGAVPVELAGVGPHVGYVGALHQEHPDVPLVVELARTH